jgi:hypothetical protein
MSVGVFARVPGATKSVAARAPGGVRGGTQTVRRLFEQARIPAEITGNDVHRTFAIEHLRIPGRAVDELNGLVAEMLDFAARFLGGLVVGSDAQHFSSVRVVQDRGAMFVFVFSW